MKKILIALAACATMAEISTSNAQQPVEATKVAPQQTTITRSEQVKITDPVDPTTKGPAGEAVYIESRDGKYYLAANGGKIFLDAKVDPSMRGPKGQSVYTGPGGGKYYINEKGEKIVMGNKNSTEKATPVKPGSVKKADTAPPAK